MKVCLIYSFTPSGWMSCKAITSNLHKAYESIPDIEIHNINYSLEMPEAELLNSLQDVSRISPDLIAFIDHRPHPHLFLYQLHKVWKDCQKAKYIFHLFGDFTLDFIPWKLSEKYLTNKNVHFFAPSHRQETMLESFIPENFLSICPYPISGDEFYFDEKLRTSERKNLGFKDEKVFLYTGRLSRQKNILQLIENFGRLSQVSKTPLKLILAGECDAIGEPFLNKREVEGEYFQEILRTLNSLPEEIRSQIICTGLVTSEKLNRLYNAADVYINLSTHNDEDFGMACAEALKCGLPSILTSWGGFSSFAQYSAKVDLVPVTLSKKRKIVDEKRLLILMKNVRILSTEERAQHGEMVTNILSPKEVSHLIRPYLVSQNSFVAFKELLLEAFKLAHAGNPFLDPESQSFNEFYHKLYSHYLGHIDER